MRNLQDYKGKQVYIKVDTQEQYLEFIPILNTVGRGWKDCHDAVGKYIDLYNDNIKSTRELNPKWDIIHVTEFLENKWIPKVGEWCYYLGKDAGGVDTGPNHWKKGIIAKFKSEDAINYRFSESSNGMKNCSNVKEAFRKATPEEIAQLTQCRFEVGKWYKVTIIDNTYFKFKSIERKSSYNQINCFDIIWKGEYDSEESISNTEVENSAILLIDLSQIQQYLPDGHVDKIVNSHNMFKKDDYIVLLKGYDKEQFSTNWCYKQRRDTQEIAPYKDNRGNDANFWNNNLFKTKSDWRYATKEEIAEYNRLGKPFDVTTLNEQTPVEDKIFEGGYVQIIKEGRHDGFTYKVGEIYKLKYGTVEVVYGFPKRKWIQTVEGPNLYIEHDDSSKIECIFIGANKPEGIQTISPIPEKWCIKVTSENIKALSEWRTNGDLSTVKGYCNTPMGGDNGYWTNSKHSNYQEITFEQFKKYVLNEQPSVKYDPVTFKTTPQDPTKVVVHFPTKKEVKVNIKVKPASNTNVYINIPYKPTPQAKKIKIKTFLLTV